MLTIACVLFIQMGLSHAIQEAVHVDISIMNCQKCLTYWTVFITLLLHKNSIIVSIAVSFICSYMALWLSLLYDYLATIYNKLYENITETTDTEESTNISDNEATDADEVS